MKSKQKNLELHSKVNKPKATDAITTEDGEKSLIQMRHNQSLSFLNTMWLDNTLYIYVGVGTNEKKHRHIQKGDV